MRFFDNYQALCRSKGKTANGVAKELGIPSASVTQWKYGSVPRAQTLEKIAAYFRVEVKDLVYGNDEDGLISSLPWEQTIEKPLVNNDEELTEMLEDIRDNPDLRMLFSVTKGATKEDIQKAVKIIQMLKGE